jgi:coenzyme F420-reducing hydrogenase delta subunit
VLSSFQEGADGVLIAGCHPGDCHYSKGNYYTRRRLTMLGKLLEHVGIDKRRFRVKWVSASEGGRFAEVIKDMTDGVRELGPQRSLKRVISDE